MRLRRASMKRGRIEMLPLIDTVFLLLVFFIYGMLSMVVHKGIPMDLPHASTAVSDRSDYLSITIGGQGEIFLNKSPVSIDELDARLLLEKRENESLKVYIGGERTVPYEKVVRVLDAVRKAGIGEVSLETTWKEADEKI